VNLVSVVGARPQFVKLAPIQREIAARVAGGQSLAHDVVHTGQHYDAAMSEVFFRELGLSQPAVNLGVGSGSHARQTANMLMALEAYLEDKRPDAVLVFGDTNSTLAGALAATKLGLTTVHVEAGLRSFNRCMPEELNRVVTDHLCDLLLVPTDAALQNLACEGLSGRSRLVGDVMLDAVIFNLEIARQDSRIVEQLALKGAEYAVATVHRASNTHPKVIAQLLEGLNRIAQDMPVVFPMHPRTRAVVQSKLVGWKPASNLCVVEPLSYLDMLRLVDESAIVLTDSGGLQKETFILGRPCVTLREETEWGETLAAGANIVVGTEPCRLMAAVDNWRKKGWGRADELGRKALALYGQGRAAHRILDAIVADSGLCRSRS